MNREEAIDRLKGLFGNGYSKQEEALNMAIKALEQMPVTTTAGEGGVIYYPQVEGVTPTVVDAGKQERDAIDRKLVCAFIAGLISDDGERKKGLEYIRNMPPVNPTKTGYWIWCFGSHKCSNCEEYTCFSHKELLRYCPNCGVKMVEPQERSEKK